MTKATFIYLPVCIFTFQCLEASSPLNYMFQLCMQFIDQETYSFQFSSVKKKKKIVYCSIVYSSTITVGWVQNRSPWLYVNSLSIVWSLKCEICYHLTVDLDFLTQSTGLSHLKPQVCQLLVIQCFCLNNASVYTVNVH